LALQGYQVGVPPEYQTVSKNQKKLIREAIYIYQRKGTDLALSTFAESTTGYAPTVRVSPNILLSMEDSSFYKGVGNWRTFGGVTFTSIDTIDTSTAETATCDTEYVGSAVVSAAGASIGNGVTQSIASKIPITKVSELTLSYYARTASSTNSITPKITWYNYLGEAISSATTSSQSINTSWAKKTLTAWAPGFVGTITEASILSNVVTVTLDTPHPFAVGNSVIVAGVDSAVNGTRTITGVTSNTFTFSLTAANQTFSNLSGDVRKSDWTYTTQTKYASIELIFNSTGTVYLDYVQLAPVEYTSYYDARCIAVELAPSKINYLKNPSFLSTGTAWTTDATATSYPATTVVGVYGGLSMLALTTKATGTTTLSTTTDAGLPLDKFYTFSIFGKSATANQVIDLKITATEVSTSAVVATQTTTATLTNIWTRPSVTIFVPASATNIEIKAEVLAAGAGKVLNFDCAQVESNLEATDYIDGSMPTDYSTGWSGTAHASTSHQYVNKEVRLARLTSEIEKYLPATVSYRVVTDDGVEVAKITY